MSNLLNSPAGVTALREATADVVRMRIRRWFERNTVIGFDNWVLAGKPPLTVNDALGVLDSLNVAHDKEILDLLDLLYQIEHTSSDINIDYYVNTANGNDITGDGSFLNPFKTMPYAQRLVPSFINSQINIFLSAPPANPVTVMSDMRHSFGDNGQLTIQGIDPPVIESGPYIVNTYTQIGAVYSLGARIVPIGAPPWVVDSKVGYFIHVLSGAQQGYYYAIIENGINELIINHTANVLAPGDSFEIVKPGTSIDFGVVTSVGIELSYKLNLWVYDSKFCLANLNFVGWSGINFNLIQMFMCASLVNIGYGSFCGNMVEFNREPLLFPNELIDPYLRPIGYPNCYITYIDVDSDRIQFWGVTCYWIYIQKASAYFIDAGFGSMTIWCGTFVLISGCLCRTTIADTITTLEGFSNVEIDSYGVWVEGCDNFFNLYKGCISCALMEGIPANINGYTAIIGGVSNMTFDGTPLSGVIGDINWASTGAVGAFPGVAGTSITDGNGSYVVKLT